VTGIATTHMAPGAAPKSNHTRRTCLSDLRVAGPTPPIALRPGASICRVVERIGTSSDAEEWATLFAVVVQFGRELISI